MSDYVNGRPPGQNNLDAGSPAYVLPENDPSAMAQKSDDDRNPGDGIEPQDEIEPEVQAELDEAVTNLVYPSTAASPKPPVQRAPVDNVKK